VAFLTAFFAAFFLPLTVFLARAATTNSFYRLVKIWKRTRA
jgi:hypothetical protein